MTHHKNKPTSVRDHKTSLVNWYNHFLSLMKGEKQAKEAYLKELNKNVSAVSNHLKALDEKQSTSLKGCAFIMMRDTLKIYLDVLQKSQQQIIQETTFIDTNLIYPLSTVLSEDKKATEYVNQSINLIGIYNKQQARVEVLKKQTADTYSNFEENVLIDESIMKVTTGYLDEPVRQPSSPLGHKIHPYFTKLDEYKEAVAQFNKDAPNLLRDSVRNCNNQIGCCSCQSLEAHNEDGTHCEGDSRCDN